MIPRTSSITEVINAILWASVIAALKSSHDLSTPAKPLDPPPRFLPPDPVTARSAAMSPTTNKLNRKIKLMIRRWHSSKAITSEAPDSASSDAWRRSASFSGDEVPPGYHPVYVGKSRRRYLVSSDLVGHPMFQNLLERSGEGGGSPAVIGCEVVLFEHLLWMLEDAGPKPESLDELVEFYAC